MECMVCKKKGKLFGIFAGVSLIYCKEHEFVFEQLITESKKARDYEKRRI